MCGRYYLAPDALEDVLQYCDQKQNRIPDWKAKDIHPTEAAPVLAADRAGSIEMQLQHWGFSSLDGKGVIFNARAETVLEKRVFAESVWERRAAIPASSFYEWDAAKQKWTFRRKDGTTLFLGGFWKAEHDADRFVILTTKPNKSMKPIHDRMPLILEADEVRSWILTDGYRDILSKGCPELERTTAFEQMRLF